MAGTTAVRPFGLRKLQVLDSVEVLSKWTCTGSTYEFRDRWGRLLFSCSEDPRGRSGLGFNLTLADVNDVEVLSFTRPSTISLSDVEVFMLGAPAGSVRPLPTPLAPVLELHDAAGAPHYRLKGPWHQTADFQLSSVDDKVSLGAITRKWSGWRKELMSRRDDYTVTFPRDLDLNFKATCIAAAVYIIHIRRSQHFNLMVEKESVNFKQGHS